MNTEASALPSQNTGSQNPIIITADTKLWWNRLKNFYITNAFQWFVWMIFHFSVVFFFTFQLQSVALVGVFLGIANAIAFFLDIPVGIIQRYFSTKKLFIIWAISQLIATGIFFSFIYNFFHVIGDVSKVVVPNGFSSILDWFFWSALNWILIIIASICYGLTKEINDISTYGYILSHASPGEYSTILARNNITYGLGSLFWLVLSWIILSVNPTFAVIMLWVIITWFIAFTIRFFDNENESIEAKDIASFTIAVTKINKDNVKEYISEKISAIDLERVLSQTKYIFLKPKQKVESNFKWKELISETISTAKIIYKILSHMPIYIIIYWTMSLVLIFGFWDTFASTFLIDFLDQVKSGWSYILLAVIAIPALWLQEFVGKIAQKVGVKSVAFVGLWLSGLSLICMGIFANSSGLVIMICALINSIWYACGMSLGQNWFLDAYNKIYAETMNLKEIDSNASAGPMKILQNLANVVWLVLGWLILGILDYRGFFIIFGMGIIGVLIWSIKRKDAINI